MFTRKHLCQSLFLSCNFINKETLAQRFFCEFCKIFKNSFFTEHLQMNTSIFQPLLALYFAIIYSWQLSIDEKSLVEKRIHPYISRTLQIQISFTRTIFSISLTNACLSCRLLKAYAVFSAVNRFVGSETPKRNAFYQF